MLLLFLSSFLIHREFFVLKYFSRSRNPSKVDSLQINLLDFKWGVFVFMEESKNLSFILLQVKFDHIVVFSLIR